MEMMSNENLQLKLCGSQSLSMLNENICVKVFAIAKSWLISSGLIRMKNCILVCGIALRRASLTIIIGLFGCWLIVSTCSVIPIYHIHMSGYHLGLR